MAVDPSIALQVGQGVQPINPLATANSAQQFLNSQAYNKLLNVNTQTAQQGLAQTQLKALGGVAQSALSMIPPTYDPNNPATYGQLQPFVKALHDGITQATSQGVIGPGTAQQLLTGIANTDHPETLIPLVRQYAYMGLDNNTALSRIAGQNGTMSNGALTQPGVATDPSQMIGAGPGAMPFRPMGPPITQGLQPGQQSELVPVPEMDANGNPTGRTIMATKAQVAAGNGLSNLLPTSLFPNGGRNQPPATGATGTAPTNAPTAPGAPVPLGKTLAPGEAEAMKTAQTGAANQGVALAQAADAVPTTRAQLQNIATDLQNITTGPGTARVAAAEAFLRKYAGLGLTLTPQQLASTENMEKLTKQLAISQAGSLGQGTDAKLMESLAANPNLDYSKLGNQNIIALLQGGLDAVQAKNNAWQAYQAKNGPGSYNQFAAQFNNTFDPRVFQFARIAPTLPVKDRAALYNSILKNDANKFLQSWHTFIEQSQQQ